MSNNKIEFKKYPEDDAILLKSDIAKLISPVYNRPDGEYRVRCNHTDIELVHSIGNVDKNGDEIFYNHILLEFDEVICEVTYMEIGGCRDYGLSNYHCGLCPINSDSVLIIGVIDPDTNEGYLYIKEEK